MFGAEAFLSRGDCHGRRPAGAFVFLNGSRELLAARIAARRNHFMPASLLDSQLATLEPPAADEQAIAIDIALSAQSDCRAGGRFPAQLTGPVPQP